MMHSFNFWAGSSFGVISFLFFLTLAVISPALAQIPDTLWSENWETGIGSWFASNGVWEVGMPMVGPSSPHSGQNCAGTILGGDYPNSSNTRLTSPLISLPGLSSGEKLKLRFWHWMRMDNRPGHYDHGLVRISTDNGSTWTDISGNYDEYSEVWTQAYIDISAYANSTVRIGFFFVSSGLYTDRGWYVDDISILKGLDVFNNPEDFEAGMGDWSVDNGLWEISVPTNGPSGAHSGQFCAGTIQDGNYFNSANTRLISPEITLTPMVGQLPELFFWHWFRMDNRPGHYDHGLVQISVNGGSWQTIADPYDEYNNTWSQAYVDLSAYADSTVRIAFYFVSSSLYVDNGWYIDDVRLEGIQNPTSLGEIHFPPVRDFELYQNYPNPFNSATTIRYTLPQAAQVKLTVFNVLGQQVAELVNEHKPAGKHVVLFDGNRLASGVYLYRIQAGEFQQVRKMLLIK